MSWFQGFELGEGALAREPWGRGPRRLEHLVASVAVIEKDGEVADVLVELA